MDLKEALEFVADLQQQALEKTKTSAALPDGRLYWEDSGVLVKPASLSTVTFHTLGGLAAYAAANRDELAIERCMVHVESVTEVNLIRAADPVYRERNVVATAIPPAVPRHLFGQALDIEPFVIWVMTAFVQDEETTRLLKIVGNLRSERGTEVLDDGVTQVATVRTGSVRSGQAEVRNPFVLQPFRTFPEVMQPASPFILRLQDRDGGTPRATLIEGADTSWVGEAMAGISHRLVGELRERKVENLPVLV